MVDPENNLQGTVSPDQVNPELPEVQAPEAEAPAPVVHDPNASAALNDSISVHHEDH